MNKNFLTIIIVLLFIVLVPKLALGKCSLKTSLDKLISNSELSKTAIVSVSVRDAKTGTIVYERHADQLLHPASTLKAFTTPVILNILGKDYKVKTSLYGHNDDLYLKLSGDPLLTEKKLSELFKNSGIKEIKGSIIIDDTTIDNISWGVGWMWDDAENPLMPKFNAYNIDHNLKINQKEKLIPVEDPKKLFISKLKKVLEANKIAFNGDIQTGTIPIDAGLVYSINHGIKQEINNINKNSDNLAAETLLKIVANNYKDETGTTKVGLEVFRNFYKKIGADTAKLLIVDGSGVSHNNLIQTNWMSLALYKLQKNLYFEIYLNSLAKPEEKGTLNIRLKNFSNQLWAKTGTIAGVSGITGYLKADSGELYSFAILIQNYKGSSHKAKLLEDKILNTIKKP